MPMKVTDSFVDQKALENRALPGMDATTNKVVKAIQRQLF